MGQTTHKRKIQFTSKTNQNLISFIFPQLLCVLLLNMSYQNCFKPCKKIFNTNNLYKSETVKVKFQKNKISHKIIIITCYYNILFIFYSIPIRWGGETTRQVKTVKFN